MKLLGTAVILMAMSMSLSASACGARASSDMIPKNQYTNLLPNNSQPANTTATVKATASAQATDGVRR